MHGENQIQSSLDESIARVRELQQKLKIGDPGVDVDLIKDEIQKMLALRQQLRETSETQVDIISDSTKDLESTMLTDPKAEKSMSTDIAIAKSCCNEDDNQIIERVQDVEAWLKASDIRLCLLEDRMKKLGRAKEMLTALDAISSENCKNRQDKSELRETIGSLTEQILTDCTNEKDSIKAIKENHDIIAATKEKESLQKQILVLTEKVEKIENEKLAISQNFQSKCKENEKAVKALDTAHQTTESLKIEYDDKIAHMQQAKLQLEKECERLRNEISAFDIRWDTTNQQCETMQTEITTLKHSLTSIEAEKEALQAEIQSIKQVILSEIETRDKALDEARSTAEKFESLMSELRRVKADNHTIKEAHYEEKIKNESLETQVKTLRSSLTAQEVLVKKSSVAMLQSNEELKDAQHGVQKWKSTAQTTKQQLFEKTNEIVRNRKQLTQAQTELATAISKTREQTRQIQQIKGDLQKLKSELQQAQAKILTSEQSQSSLKATQATLVKEKANALKANAQLIKDIGRMERYRTAFIALVPVITSVVVLYSIFK